MSQNQNETGDLEVVETSALEAMERVQIDVQIATAKKYPRVMSLVKKAMLEFATLDIETAEGCFYTLPARRGGDNKPIQGPSVRMAEIAISCYQNLRAGARIISDDGEVLTAQGICHDLQNNVSVTMEVKRRVTNRDGDRYSPDMVIMTGNAACSIALRNATFRVVPLALVKPVYEEAKKVAIGDAKTLVTRRAAALSHFMKMGVSKEKVFAVVNCKAIEDIGLEQLETLIGYSNAIRDQDTTIDEVFNREPEQQAKKPKDYFTKKQPVPEQPTEAPSSPQGASEATKAPEAVSENKAAETPAAGARRQILEANVPFDLFVAELKAQSMLADADSIPSYEEIKMATWAVLATHEKLIKRIIKKSLTWGKA